MLQLLYEAGMHASCTAASIGQELAFAGGPCKSALMHGRSCDWSAFTSTVLPLSRPCKVGMSATVSSAQVLIRPLALSAAEEDAELHP